MLAADIIDLGSNRLRGRLPLELFQLQSIGMFKELVARQLSAFVSPHGLFDRAATSFRKFSEWNDSFANRVAPDYWYVSS